MKAVIKQQRSVGIAHGLIDYSHHATQSNICEYSYFIEFAIGILGDVFSFLKLCLQECDSLVVGQAAAFKCFAVPAEN